MSDVKLLNLDEVGVIKRVVRIKGNDYQIAEQSLGDMISRMELAKAAKAKPDNTPLGVMKELVSSAKQLLPSAPEALIDSLNAAQIGALFEFVNAKDSELMGEEAKGEPESGDAEKKL